jgi:Tol biopolymer transport system component
MTAALILLASSHGESDEITRVSVATGGIEATGNSRHPSLSDDGRYVAFDSAAPNLVAGDDRHTDVFVYDRHTGQTSRVSVGTGGAQPNDDSSWPSISADGRYVAFTSYASNLVAGDTNNWDDVFVHDRQTGKTDRVSVRTGGGQTSGGYGAYPVSISGDGRYVAFDSFASNLVAGDTNGERDVFVHDRQTRRTTRVSVATSGIQANGMSGDPAISRDGRYVAFLSYASNLVPGDTNNTADVFVHDRQTRRTTRVSVGSGGAPGNGWSGRQAISSDGRYVAFQSDASNLVAGDTNGTTDVFVHDRQTRRTSRVSVKTDGTQANGPSYAPHLSGDGRHVTFESISDLGPGGAAFGYNVFIHDRQTGETAIVRVTPDGAPANYHSFSGSISGDGRYVAFESGASNLVAGDTNGAVDVFVRVQTSGTIRVSVAAGGGEANRASGRPSISGDGRYVAFFSTAANLVAGDTNDSTDVFVHDRQTGATTRVSVSTGGAEANAGGTQPAISGDGRYVAFMSAATNLVAGDTNQRDDIFVHDRATGETTLVSVATGGAQANGHSLDPSISDDGRYVAFTSNASNLAGDSIPFFYHVYVHDRQTGETTRASAATGGAQANGFSMNAFISGDGRYVAFASDASNLAGDTNHARDIFVHDRQTGETTRISVATAGAEATGNSDDPTLSDDGRYVAFKSDASNLAAGDTNNAPDIFVHDRQTGETTRVSVATGGVQANRWSARPSISGDGRYIAFTSDASNLVAGDTNQRSDVFVHDRHGGETARVSIATGGAQANGDSDDSSISGDGRSVAFSSQAPNLVAGDTNNAPDIFVRRR